MMTSSGTFNCAANFHIELTCRLLAGRKRKLLSSSLRPLFELMKLPRRVEKPTIAFLIF